MQFRRLMVGLMTLISMGPFSQNSFAGPPEWSQRGVFAFDEIVLDFEKKIEAFGPITTTLENCSTEQYYCAYADIVHIVLPKQCVGVQVGDRWTVNGVTTVILDQYVTAPDPGIHGGAPRRVLLLGDPQFPDTVYSYEIKSGVRGIYWGYRKNFVQQAHEGMLRTEGTDRFFKLQTFDTFGRCSEGLVSD